MADAPDNILSFPLRGKAVRASAKSPDSKPAQILAELLAATDAKKNAPHDAALVEQVIEGHGNVQITYGYVTRQVIRGNGNVQLNDTHAASKNSLP